MTELAHRQESASTLIPTPRSGFSPDLNPTFLTNDTLNQVCSVLETTMPKWAAITELAGERSIRRESLHGIIAERHVQRLLEEALSNFPLLSLNPIPTDPTPHRQFSFKRNRVGNIIAWDNERGRTHAEYDALIEVDGLPVVVETKISNRSRRGETGHGIDTALSNKQIDRRFAPLREFYGHEGFGYVVVTTKERVVFESPFQDAFRNKGGRLVPLPVSNKEIKAVVANTVFPSELHLLQQRHNQRMRR